MIDLKIECEYLKLFVETELEFHPKDSQDYKDLLKIKNLDDVDELMGDEFGGYVYNCMKEIEGMNLDVVKDRERILDIWGDVSALY